MEHAELLMNTVRSGVRHAAMGRGVLTVAIDDYPVELQRVAATFVTLHHHGKLRGCMGTLQASKPLILDAIDHAHAAAVLDPRFTPVPVAIVDELSLHLSVLSPLEPVTFTDEANLIAQLEPGVDGLVLEKQGKRGTFLPAVWKSLPQPGEFLQQLRVKAGLEPDCSLDGATIHRYRVTELEG